MVELKPARPVTDRLEGPGCWRQLVMIDGLRAQPGPVTAGLHLSSRPAIGVIR